MVDIERQIVAILQGVTGIQRVYDYPAREIGRALPAATVVYAGFQQSSQTARQVRAVYRWDIACYWPAEGKTLEQYWARMKAQVKAIIDAFRVNEGLNGAVYGSLITEGEPVVVLPPDEAGQPQYIGHTFRLEAWRDEP